MDLFLSRSGSNEHTHMHTHSSTRSHARKLSGSRSHAYIFGFTGIISLPHVHARTHAILTLTLTANIFFHQRSRFFRHTAKKLFFSRELLLNFSYIFFHSSTNGLSPCPDCNFRVYFRPFSFCFFTSLISSFVI